MVILSNSAEWICSVKPRREADRRERFFLNRTERRDWRTRELARTGGDN